MDIPQGHQTVMPYLILEGSDRFMEFTREVFNAELSFSTMREDGKTVMHAEIRIGGCTIMFAEATEQWKKTVGGFFIYVENADRSFAKAKNAGAEIIMDLSDQSYGRTGGVKDPCGNTWWITSIS